MAFGIGATEAAVVVLAMLVGGGATAAYYRRVRLELDDAVADLEREALAELGLDDMPDQVRDAIDDVDEAAVADLVRDGLDDADEDFVTYPIRDALDELDEDAVADRIVESVETRQEDAVGYGVEFGPPNVGRNPLDILRLWLHNALEGRMAKRGYVKWFRVGARLHRPKWVKPEKKGAGEYEYYDSSTDTTYLFPEDALVADGATSAYVAVHRVGESEPIDLRDPGWPALDGDVLQRFIDMAVARDPPNRLSKLPISRQQAVYGGMAILAFGTYLAMQSGAFGG